MNLNCKGIKWSRYLKTIGLGQLLSVLISGTGICSQLLAVNYNVNIPTTQSFLNYLLLTFYLVYHIVNSTKSNHNAEQHFTFRDLFWSKKTIFYFFLSIADVEANFVGLLNSSVVISSVMLLDCFSIPCVMILSWIFLQTRYTKKQYLGVGCCLIGLGVLVTSDYFYNRKDDDATASNPILGDFLCLLAASLYSISNVGQEYMIRKNPRTEWLGMMGLFGSFICGLQVAIAERNKLAHMSWNGPIAGLLIGFAMCLFWMYSFTPLMLHVSSATLFNLSLLTSDVFAIIAGIFLFHHKPTIWYFVSFFAIIVGLILYNFGASEKDEKAYKQVPETIEETPSSINS